MAEVEHDHGQIGRRAAAAGVVQPERAVVRPAIARAPKFSPTRRTGLPSQGKSLKVHISASGSWTKASEVWLG